MPVFGKCPVQSTGPFALPPGNSGHIATNRVMVSANPSGNATQEYLRKNRWGNGMVVA